MKYFAPITKLDLCLLWEMPLPGSYANVLFIQSKKDGTPIKNASVFHVHEMNGLKYDYKLVNLRA